MEQYISLRRHYLCMSQANVLLSDRKRKYHSHRCIVRAMANQTPLNGEAISLHKHPESVLYAGTQPCFGQIIKPLIPSSRSFRKIHRCLTLVSPIFNILSQDNGTSPTVVQVRYLSCKDDQVCECLRLAMKGHVICCCCVSLKGGISSCMGQNLALITRIVPRLNSSWKEVVC
jgi:hypothetical protein